MRGIRRYGKGAVAVVLVALLGACVVHDNTVTGTWTEIRFIKECDATASRINVTNTSTRTIDLDLMAWRGTTTAHSSRTVAPGNAVAWMTPLDASNLQVTVISGTGHDELFGENVPTCA